MNNTLKTIVWITAGVAVVSLGIASVLFFATGMHGFWEPRGGITVDEQQTFAMAGVDRIDVRTSSTDVYVAPGDGDSIDVRLHGTMYAGDPDEVRRIGCDVQGNLRL